MQLGRYFLPGHSLIRFNDILKAAVWNQSSTFAKFYFRDMSQQVANLHSLGPIVVAQKVVGGKETQALYGKKTDSLLSQLHIMFKVINI